MKNVKKTNQILLTAFFFLITLNGISQIINLKNDKYWVSSGVGTYFGSTNGVKINTSINYAKNNNLYKLYYAMFEEINFFGPAPHEYYNEANLMYGGGKFKKYYNLQFSLGLGILNGVKRGNQIPNGGDGSWFSLSGGKYEKVKFTTIGVPIGIDFQFTPMKYVGIGCSVNTNFNIHKFIGGFAINLSIGKHR